MLESTACRTSAVGGVEFYRGSYVSPEYPTNRSEGGVQARLGKLMADVRWREESELLFLDTEWATGAGRELVSLALVNADDRKRFYAKCGLLPEVASSFVRQFVYPLLERGDAGLPNRIFTERLRVFVASCDNHAFTSTVRSM